MSLARKMMMAAAGASNGLSARWRMNITAITGASSSVYLYGLQLRDVSGGADLTSPADAVARSSVSSAPYAGFEADKAYDDDNATRWISDVWAGGPEWTEWEFAAPVTIVEVAWLGKAADNSPQDFDIQYYDADLASWQTYWSETGQTISAAFQISTYPG